MGRDFGGYRVVISPGLYGSGPDHWQSRWQRLYPHFERVEQENWDAPDLDVWAEQLARVLRASPQPVLVAGHSFGCLIALRCAELDVPNLAGALMVAPADPARFEISERLEKIRPAFPTIAISSSDDPWMESARAVDWATTWGSEFIDLGPLGHINAESGLGDWEFGLAQLRRVAELARLPGA